MGPLDGVTIVEMAGIGPGPFAGMMLADLGARIIRIDRLTPGALAALNLAADGAGQAAKPDVVARGRESIAVNLKDPRGIEIVLDLIERADALIEGYRPGVMERLGLGPDVALARNPKLVFGRMTGWGQDGPMSPAAGHDVNYISLSGALAAIGRAGERPVPPLNLVGDYGGGGLMLAYGVVSALLSVARGGAGQVVDASMVDGSAILMAQFFTMRANKMWREQRGANLLDTGAPFYDVYTTSDGGHMSVGPLEPQFFAEMIRRLGIEDFDPAKQYDPGAWPRLRELLTAAFASRTRDEWTEVFEGSDACVAPVLTMSEAPAHPHNRARGTFVEPDGVLQPAPAPRFSGTPAQLPEPAPVIGAQTTAILAELGRDESATAALRGDAVVG